MPSAAEHLLGSREKEIGKNSTDKLKRKSRVINGEETLLTRYTIQGEKITYNSESVLENSRSLTDSIVKSSKDIDSYASQLASITEQQSADYILLQVRELIDRYYSIGISDDPEPSENEYQSTDEQKHLQVAIDELVKHIERALKVTKPSLVLLNKQILLMERMLKIESVSDDRETDVAAESVASISSDLRMIQNQYRYCLKRFTSASQSFYDVQVEREKRFKEIVFSELMKDRGINEDLQQESSEILELKKLVELIVNYKPAEKAKGKDVPHEKFQPNNASEDHVEDFPRYSSSPAMVSYVSDKYYEEIALHKLEVMTELTNEVLKVEKSLYELNDLFTDMSTLLSSQSDLVDDIYLNMQNANQYVERSARTIRQSKILSQSARRRTIILGLLLVIFAGGIVLTLKLTMGREK